MNRATYCWPDDKKLCCITVQSYDDSAVDIADSIISNVERDGCTSCTCFFDNYDEALKAEQRNREFNAAMEQEYEEAQKEEEAYGKLIKGVDY